MSIITCIQNVGFIGLFLSVCISCDLGISAQTVDTKPHVILEVGTRGVLPCPIHGQAYLVEWKRQGTSELEPLVSLDPYFNVGARDGPSYKAGLVNITDDYSLVIKDVKVQNEGLYLCDVSDYKRGKHILNWTQVYVQAFPDEPFPIIRECTRKDVHPGACTLKVNSTSKLTCLVEGYYPHIELYFLHGSEKVVSTIYEWKNTDGTKNKIVTILISVSDEPYKCVASGLPGIVGNRTVTVFAQANAPPQGFNTVEIVIIFFSLFMLVGSCLFMVFKVRVRCSRSGLSRIPTDVPDIMTPPSKPVRIIELFMDPIHGNMAFKDELLIKIMNTEQFQRLRNIKQLGGCYYIYPGATHNRFEHSLGVCHLAGDFIRTLRDKQPELNINDKDIRRVEIAGLCHDLGHGPLSRAFDKVFIPRRSLKHPEIQEGLKNEDLSVMMFDHLIQQNNLKNEDLNDSDIKEIKRMIQGVKDGDDDVAAEKRFLYQIVTNKSTFIDVDKFDYLVRDSHQLGKGIRFDFKRCMESTRVIKHDDGRRILCFRDKEADSLFQMFEARYTLHKNAYQNRVSTITELMIMDAFEMAEDARDDSGEKCFKIFPAKDGSKLTMTDTLVKQDMHAYTYMTDSIVERILSSREKGLEEAREVLKNVIKGDETKLYKLVKEVQIPSDCTEDFLKKWKEEHKIVDDIVRTNAGLEDYFTVKVVTINYGRKDQNPIKNVRFYTESDPDKAVLIKVEEISSILPKAFQEVCIRVYCKKPDAQRNADVKAAFEKWYKNEKDSLKRLKEEALNRDRGQKTPGKGYVGTSSTRDREEQERPSTEPSGKSVQRNLFPDSSDSKGRGSDEQECKQTRLTDMV